MAKPQNHNFRLVSRKPTHNKPEMSQISNPTRVSSSPKTVAPLHRSPKQQLDSHTPFPARKQSRKVRGEYVLVLERLRFSPEHYLPTILVQGS